MNNAIDEFEYKFERDIFPQVISVGHCINVRNCKATNVDLADGWCVNCWDKGETAKNNIVASINRREEVNKSKLLVKERKQSIKERQRAFYSANPPRRGRHKRDCQCETHLKKGVV